MISYAKTNLTINGYPIEMTLRLTFVGEVGYGYKPFYKMNTLAIVGLCQDSRLSNTVSNIEHALQTFVLY